MRGKAAEIRLVIFDLDGTLVDSAQVNRFFYNGIKTRLGLPPMTPEEEAASFVQPVSVTLERIIPAGLLDQALAQAEATDWAAMAEMSRLQEGAGEFVRALERAGVGRAVNTNGGSEARITLDRLGLAGAFDLIVSADDVARPKPWPDGVGLILERLGVVPGEAVYIGDSQVDGRTARAAGVEFWAYQAPHIRADLHLGGYGRLTRILEAGGPAFPGLERPKRG